MFINLFLKLFLEDLKHLLYFQSPFFLVFLKYTYKIINPITEVERLQGLEQY